MKVSIKSMAIIVVGAFAVGIAGANLLGLWQTTSSKQPVAIKEGEFAGLPNPADIRGSYTWADVAKAFDFDTKLILTAFGSSDESEKVNTLEALYGAAGLPAGIEIGTDSVRLFVSLLTGLPHTAEDTTVLPVSAIAVLRESGKADAALIDAAAAKAYDPAKTASSAVPLADDHVATAGALTGKTTFKELRDWGLSETEIKSVTGGNIGADGSIVKDWMAANGLTFSELKAKLQELLDAKK